MKIKKIAVFIIVIASVALCVLLYMRSEFHRTRYIQNQLENIYGTEFAVLHMDEKMFNKQYSFSCQSEEGIYFCGICDWKGELKKDSYAHYYYAPNLNQDLYEKIGGCFEECFIVRDCIKGDGNYALTDVLDLSKTQTYEDYLKSEKKSPVNFKVYVKEDVSNEQLQNALDIMEEEHLEYRVKFLKVPDDIYTMLTEVNRQCYFIGSQNADYLYENTDLVDYATIRELLFEPGKYCVARFDLELGISEVEGKDE